MPISIIGRLPILLLIVSFCWLLMPARINAVGGNKVSSSSEGGVTAFTRKVIGVRKTETLKIGVYDLTPLPRRVVLVSIRLKDMAGKIIARSDKNRLAPGEPYSFVFQGNTINARQEKATDSIQLDVTIIVESPKQEKQIDKFSASIEIIDGRTGKVRKWPDITLKRGSVATLLGLNNPNRATNPRLMMSPVEVIKPPITTAFQSENDHGKRQSDLGW